MILVRIPTILRKLTKGEEILFGGSTVGEVLENLCAAYPGVAERIYDDKGNIRRFVNIYLNQNDIRCLEDEVTPVEDGDEISIVPAMAGG